MPNPRPPRPSAPRPAGPAPTQAVLHEAALRHLARFGTTEAGLTRVLDRKVQRWAWAAASEGRETDQDASDARASVRTVVRSLAAAGAVDDAAFAEARAARLVRSGRSRRATQAHLAAKGVGAEQAEAALAPHTDELAAALAFARRRRIGPFGPPGDAPLDPAERLRALGVLARAGFPRDVAEHALDTEPDAAAAAIIALKRG